ncbi:hypothetical protein E4U43_000183 [Claviceps pusilla]|uniref:Uncharacterized protein n=1 Tax=Claviceps pusilla TaxID=123648 RepID=A0A9P7NAE4_9HYPO|nr:hypothetical protein E4U43_000183 [Claviceps pusilla]
MLPLPHLPAILSAVAVFFANQAMAAPGQDVTSLNDVSARADQGSIIATDAFFACNCPNNCSHKYGSSCKYYKNFSDSGPVASGKCGWKDGQLFCYA